MAVKPYKQPAWALLWRSENRLDGVTRHLIIGPPYEIMLFRTRREARDYNANRFGYIKDRPDLQGEPHGWEMPQVVRVVVTIEQISG